jgi:hypothetical protein
MVGLCGPCLRRRMALVKKEPIDLHLKNSSHLLALTSPSMFCANCLSDKA